MPLILRVNYGKRQELFFNLSPDSNYTASTEFQIPPISIQSNYHAIYLLPILNTDCPSQSNLQMNEMGLATSVKLSLGLCLSDECISVSRVRRYPRTPANVSCMDRKSGQDEWRDQDMGLGVAGTWLRVQRGHRREGDGRGSVL